VNHYNAEHNVPFSDMVDHFIHTQATAEQMDRKGVEMSDLEFSLLAPDGSDGSRFVCKTCDKSLHKSSAVSHFIKQHGTPSDEVKGWVVAKDAAALRHKKPQKMLLTSAYDTRFALELLGEPGGEQSCTEGAPLDGGMADTSSGGAGTSRFMQPKAKSHARGAGGQPAEIDLATLSDQICKLSQHVADIRVGAAATVPTAQLAGEARAWEMDDASKAKQRVQWPLKKAKKAAIDFTEFEAWLGTRVGDESRKYIMQGLEYFYSMVEVTFADGSEFDHVGALQAVHQQGVFQGLLELPIFSSERSWTQKAVCSLEHYINFCLIVCVRNNHIEAQKFISLLQKDLLAGLKKRTSKSKKIASIGKNRSDCAKMKALPPIGDMKGMVKQAMLDLCTISKACDGREVTFGERLSANTCIVGIVYYNGFAGRSKEWEVMPAAHVAEQLAECKDFLVCPNHKTASTYGELGKYLAPGTLDAVKVYAALGSPSGKFLVPPKETSTRVAVALMLKRFNKKYGPQYQNANVNLLRKWYHKEVVNPRNQNSVMKFMARIDGHSEAVAQKVYKTSDPEQDALFGKHLVTAVLGDTVEFPSAQEIQQCGLAVGEVTVGEGACDSDDGSASESLGEEGSAIEGEIDVEECLAEEDDVEAFGVKRSSTICEADFGEQPKKARQSYLLRLALAGTSSLCQKCAASGQTGIMKDSVSCGSGARTLTCSMCDFTSTV
jgi:hypothetical protein